MRFYLELLQCGTKPANSCDSLSIESTDLRGQAGMILSRDIDVYTSRVANNNSIYSVHASSWLALELISRNEMRVFFIRREVKEMK